MLTLSLVTPAKKLITDVPVEEVFVPAYRGELNILPGHAALMSTLETGILRYRNKGSNTFEHVAISWGYLEVLGDHVTVLAETAEVPAEIELSRAQAAKAKAEKALASAELEQNEFKKYNMKLQRAQLRIALATEQAAAEGRANKTSN